MDLSLLPTEMIEEVAGYLSLDDIKACSEVNTQWRIAFDNDRVWKKYFTFHPNYFNKQVTKLRKSSTYFVRGCKSKRHLFQELKVRKNLVEGRYDVVQGDIGRLYCDNLVDVIDEVGNHWFFISCAENNLFENMHLIKVWNVMDKCIIHHQTKETALGITRRIVGSEMRAIKNKLYYFFKHILVAFEFSPPEYDLTTLFVLKCPRFDFDFIRIARRETVMVYKPNMVLGFVYTYQHASRSADPWVHVWSEGASLSYKNYSTAEIDLMREVEFNRDLYLDPSILEIKDGGSSDTVLLVCKRGTFEFSVRTFNIKTFQYTTLFVKQRVKFICSDLVKEVVVVLCSSSRGQEFREDNNEGQMVLCYSTNGDLIYQMESLPFSDVYHHIVTANEGKEVLVLSASGRATVHDVFEKKVISKFRIPRGVIGVTLIKDNIIIIQLQQKKKTAQEVWDFKRGIKLYGFDELQSFTHESGFYKFAFNKNYRSPPKMFAIKEPNHYYCKPCNGEIVMISFL